MTADDKTLDLLLRQARTHNDFLEKPVPEELLRAAHELMKHGPTSTNSQPMRVLYLRSPESREKLAPALGPTNRDKTLKAPMVAIVAYDTRFWEHLPRMFHKPEAVNLYKDKPAVSEITAFRNGTLQGGYMILAARALGLDCGPMSGFDNAGVDQEFFAGTSIKSNFLCNLGYGDPAGVRPRGPRLAFDEMARII